jgi:class 3 adenylate cyclase/TolB-like protein/cytochrome c-type biogenesis protein CcmH/NrfG
VATSLRNDARTSATRLQVGAWEVDSARNEIRRGVEAVRLEPKVVEVLLHLAIHPGEVISREELLSAVWPGVIVGDDALTQAIIKLRKAVGDDAHKPTYIETISKRGYRLIAPVEALEEGAAAPARGAESRRLAAILSADIAGYSRLMQEDAAATVQALKAHQAALLPLVTQLDGRVIDLAGDGILAEFPSAVGAVQCAIAMQRVMATANASIARPRRLQFRIGVHIGDVIRDAKRIYGDGVNIAARIQALALPGGVVVSQAVFEQVRDKLEEHFIALGEARLKNIREPVSLHQAVLGWSAPRAAWIERWSFALRTRRVGAKPTAIAAALIVVLGVAVAIALVGKSLRMPWPIGSDIHGAVSTAIPVVAILPLANLSGDQSREYFSDGVTEDLIGALGRFSGLRVMSRAAVQVFKGKPVAPQAIREELGVAYIVQGSIRGSDGKMRIAVELSDTDHGVLIWSEHYDAQGAQLFDIQDRIARSIVGMLHVKLTEAERARVFMKSMDNLEAYDLVLRARALSDPPERRTNREARELLARALKLAPGDADALTALGEAELNRARYGWVEDPDEAAARAEELAKRALASSDQRAHVRAHTLLAAIYGYRNGFEEALIHTERALQLNPSDSEALYRRGEALVRTGRVDESIVPLEASRRLEPHAVRIYLVSAYFHAGRYRDSLTLADSLLARAPDHVALNAMRAANLAMLGNIDEARRAADQVRRYSPNFQIEQWGNPSGMPEAYAARLREALKKAGL